MNARNRNILVAVVASVLVIGLVTGINISGKAVGSMSCTWSSNFPQEYRLGGGSVQQCPDEQPYCNWRATSCCKRAGGAYVDCVSKAAGAPAAKDSLACGWAGWPQQVIINGIANKCPEDQPYCGVTNPGGAVCCAEAGSGGKDTSNCAQVGAKTPEGNQESQEDTYKVGTTTYIRGCTKITHSGKYILANDIQGTPSEACIAIMANNVELDCWLGTPNNRKGMITNALPAVEVKGNIPGAPYRDRITIKNCDLRNSLRGITFRGARNSEIIDNDFDGNQISIWFNSDVWNTAIKKNSIKNTPNDGTGIYISASNNIQVISNVVESMSSGKGIYVGGSDGGKLYGNNIIGGGTGITIDNSDYVDVEGNYAHNNLPHDYYCKSSTGIRRHDKEPLLGSAQNDFGKISDGCNNWRATCNDGLLQEGEYCDESVDASLVDCEIGEQKGQKSCNNCNYGSCTVDPVEPSGYKDYKCCKYDCWVPWGCKGYFLESKSCARKLLSSCGSCNAFCKEYNYARGEGILVGNSVVTNGCRCFN